MFIGHTLSTLPDLRVEADGIEAGGGPERKRYAITDADITVLERWLTILQKPEEHLRSTDPRRLEPTAARPDQLREAVTR